ncbi:MAG: CDP-alcohol phosphatidyltransferase family protein [Aquificae bacterium]|nr:CDP-alcohol phosphatidyltransferase family protein [Aquificota bacterium]
MSLLTRRIKPFYETLLEPVVRVAQRMNLNPNWVTFLGLLLTAVGSFFLYLDYALAGVALLAVGALTDSVDGAIARRTGRVTPFGAFLDSTFDRLSDAFPFTALGVRYASQGDELGTFLSFTALFTSFGVSYTRARAESLGVKGMGGLFERTERWIVLLLALVSGFVEAGLTLITIGSTFTVIQRILYTKKFLEERR